MATLSKGYSFGATETVTNTKLSTLVDDGSISGIVNADISSGAAIAASKIDFTLGGIPTLGATQTWTGANTYSGNVIIGTANEGDIYYDNGTKMTRLIPGDAGKVLQTNGTSAAPTWVDGNPIGTILPYAGATAPTGYLLCDGDPYSRTSVYDGLFGVIGVSYGPGDSSTTYNVPDLRGRIPLGKDNMGGSSADRVTDAEADTLGGAEGDEDLQAHTHGELDSWGNHVLHSQGDHTPRNFLQLFSMNGIDSVTAASQQQTSSTGAGASGNKQPYLTINYIIKY